MTAAPPPDDPGLGPRHYQALAGVGLGVIVLVQFQQGPAEQMLIGVATGLVGGLGLMQRRLPVNPLFVLVLLAAGLIYAEYQQKQGWRFGPSRGSRFDVAEVVLSIAVLTYVASQSRLHAFWFGATPADPRARPPARAAASVTLAELVGFLASLPAFALLAQAIWHVLPRQGSPVGATAAWLDWQPILVLAWVLTLGLFVAAHVFRYRRLLRMDRPTARLLLQDVVWTETRGEQRRINRWLAWRKARKSFTAESTATTKEEKRG